MKGGGVQHAKGQMSVLLKMADEQLGLSEGDT